MTNIFSIVADQKQVIITVNSIWFTGIALIVGGILMYRFIYKPIK
jgi:hypothetical protein